MTSTKLTIISSAMKKAILVSTLIGYAALVIYLLYFVGIGSLIEVIQEASLSLYALAILSLLVSILFHTLVWFQLLRSLAIKLSFKRAYVLYWVGIFVDNIIPGGWSGDLFKAYLLNKDPNVQSGKAVASVVAKNVYEAIFNFGSMVFAIGLLLLNYNLAGSLIFSLAGILLLLALPLFILLLASFKPGWAKRLVDAFFSFLSRVMKNRPRIYLVQSKVEKALCDYHDGMRALLENPRLLIKPMFLSSIAWAFEIITLLFVFASLGQLIPLDKIVIVRSVAGNVEAQGYAFVGFAQIISSEIYGALGVPFAIAASVALLGGVVIFLLKTGISYAAFHRTVIAPNNKDNDQL
jgi:uncharacterized protein (TIRG00374 family)